MQALLIEIIHKDKKKQRNMIFNKIIKLRKAKEMLYKLTGFLSINLKTKWPNANTLKSYLVKYKEFQIKMAYPN